MGNQRAASILRSPTSLLLFALAALACEGRPVPLTAVQGSSVLIPISDADPQANGPLIGYGTEDLPDWQRGRLKLWLDMTPPFAADVELTVRSVARAAPDPASLAGLGQGAAPGQTGQVIVLADVPAAAEPGEWPIRVERYVLQYTPSGPVEQSSQAPTYHGTLKVVAGDEPSTPFEAYLSLAGVWAPVPQFVPDVIPLPRLRFIVNTTGLAGAVRVVISYPSNRVLVRKVLADPIGNTTPWGYGALVTSSESTPGILDIGCIAPSGVNDPAFAIVFELTHPEDDPASGGGPVAASNFAISSVQAFNLNGAQISASVPASNKKIL